VHAQSTRSVTLTHACCHQQKRLSSYDDALLGLCGAVTFAHKTESRIESADLNTKG
jgi:hypothetical protein